MYDPQSSVLPPCPGSIMETPDGLPVPAVILRGHTVLPNHLVIAVIITPPEPLLTTQHAVSLGKPSLHAGAGCIASCGPAF